MKNLIFILFLGGCASTSQVLTPKDFVKIHMGMEKHSVMKELGEPSDVKGELNRDILIYKVEQNTNVSDRLVVFEKHEVIFYGLPSDFSKTLKKGE